MPDALKDEREVGRVISVSTYRVGVLLDSTVRSQVRAYPHHINVVSEIGGYVLFPVAPGQTAVGIIVGAFENESVEPESDRSMTLQLGQARRTIRLNLLGQLLEDEFIPGISVYPTLDTVALLPTADELRRILEYQPPKEEKDKDTSLSLGVSPLYARQSVTASYNDLLSRPFGIIGNTGSGKSHSVASILQQALVLADGAAELAKVVILDINGEYDQAFGKGAVPTSRELNTVYLNGEPLYLPLWTFNFAELEHFFEASDRSQRPVLERVITSLRESSLDAGPAKDFRALVATIDRCLEHLEMLTIRLNAPTDAWAGQKASSLVAHIESALGELTSSTLTGLQVPDAIVKHKQAVAEVQKLNLPQHDIPPQTLPKIAAFIEKYRTELGAFRSLAVLKGNLRPITADSPVPFNATELLRDEAFHNVISRFRGQDRIQEYIATLRLRIHRQLADRRWSVFTTKTDTTLLDIFTRLLGKDGERVTVIDCSMLAHDALPFFCAVLGRLLLELRQHALPSQRTIQPFTLVLEEAHNYLRPKRDDESYGLRLSREAFERIAKEGRKFGLSLLIASQRPADVSATVLSQCANFLVHRIQNPEDIDYFKKILPTGSRDLLDQLPILSPGDGLLLGSAVNVPARVKIRKPNPPPQSHTSKPWHAWQASGAKFDIGTVTKAWLSESGPAAPESV